MTKPLWWIARISGVVAVLLLLLVVKEETAEPAGSEWAYLALFPFGFSAGYVIGWRWPFVGGTVSIACLAISQIVTGRVFDSLAYATWGVLSVPGLLFLIVGSKRRRERAVHN